MSKLETLLKNQGLSSKNRWYPERLDNFTWSDKQRLSEGDE
ncbi:hypothetical protein [Streptococcus orisratti]